MSPITIRNFDPAIEERLRVRAAQHGHSTEAEVRRILQAALTMQAKTQSRSLYDRIGDRFAAMAALIRTFPRAISAARRWLPGNLNG
jgi:plasmid stability protein